MKTSGLSRRRVRILVIFLLLNNFSLKQVKCDWNIVIKEADKGSVVVVEEIEVDPSVDLGKTINSRLKELREEDLGLEEVTEYLEVKDSKLGRFYLMPRIHKGLSSVKERPVISNSGTITEHISEYLDHHLNPLVSQSRSHVNPI